MSWAPSSLVMVACTGRRTGRARGVLFSGDGGPRQPQGGAGRRYVAGVAAAVRGGVTAGRGRCTSRARACAGRQRWRAHKHDTGGGGEHAGTTWGQWCNGDQDSGGRQEVAHGGGAAGSTREGGGREDGVRVCLFR